MRRGRGRPRRGRGGPRKERGGEGAGGLENRAKTPMMARVTHLPTSRRLALATLAAAALAALWLLAASATAATVTVAPGETLSGIAARNGVSVAALVRANGIANPNRVTAGRRLVIPGSGSSAGTSGGGGTYRVRAGDSLGSIAARHGVSVPALAAANGITNPNLVVAGRRLTIPSGGSSSGGPASGGASSSYRVRSGDTLSGIAARYGTSTSALAARNAIPAPYVIAIGRLITVPASAPGASNPTSAAEVRDLIARASARYGVDPALARAIAWHESGWNQSKRSPVGAIGVMQLMPGTARWLGREVVGRPLDAHLLADNIEGGVAYLAWLLHRTTSTHRAIGAYYQGLASLRARGPYDDTISYVANVAALVGRV